MLGLIMEATKVFEGNRKDAIYACSYLAQQLLEIYSCTFSPEIITPVGAAINPFLDIRTLKPTENAKKYSFAFVVYDLYDDLKQLFETKGYVVETPSQETSTRLCGTYSLVYYPGFSNIFVLRTQNSSKE
ncbi:MAG: hypothetical protein HFJ28_03030 [Clostridia bacterium]|nr:hypothetical protein [Clostridia bacterium]